MPIFFERAHLILAKTSDAAPSKYLLLYSRRPQTFMAHGAIFFRFHSETQEWLAKKKIGQYTEILRVRYVKWLSCKRVCNFIINFCFNVSSAFKRIFCRSLIYIFKWVAYSMFHICKVSLNRKSYVLSINI